MGFIIERTGVKVPSLAIAAQVGEAHRVRQVGEGNADALVAIANGMGVSIDWIVGRTGNSRDQRLEDRDYALACFSIVKAMLEHLQSLQRERPAQPIIDDRQVGGLEVSEAAALAMSQFLERIQHYREFSIYMGERHELQEAVAAEYSRRARLAEE